MVSLGSFVAEIIANLDINEIHIEILILDAELKERGDNENVLFRLCDTPSSAQKILYIFSDALFIIGHTMDINKYVEYTEYILYLKRLMTCYCMEQSLTELNTLIGSDFN